jgi:subunit length determinant Wzz-like protein/putative tyrosine kinase-like protein
MTQAPETQHCADDEIDVRELFATLWRGKWIIIIVTLMFAVAGASYALYKPNIYQASALLAPTEGDGGAGLGGQLGGLASLAGVNISQDGSNKVVIAKEILQSRAFLTDFIQRHHLEIPLMATIGWNMEREEWIYDRDVYNPETDQWAMNERQSLAPTEWHMVKKFRGNHLSVSENNDNGMVTVSVKSLSPLAAKNWTEWLVRDINEHMRKRDVQEAEASISYLEEKLQDTNIAGMRKVFYQLIESETRTVMLANAQKEYVFQTVDPAVVPQEKSEPKRALIVVIATMVGGMLSILTVLIRSFIKNGKDPESIKNR